MKCIWITTPVGYFNLITHPMQAATILAMATPEDSKSLVPVKIEADICKKIGEVTLTFFHDYEQSDDGVFIDHALWSSPRSSDAIENTIKHVLKLHEHPNVTEDLIYRLSLPWNNLRYHMLNVMSKMEEIGDVRTLFEKGHLKSIKTEKQLRNTVNEIAHEFFEDYPIKAHYSFQTISGTYLPTTEYPKKREIQEAIDNNKVWDNLPQLWKNEHTAFFAQDPMLNAIKKYNFQGTIYRRIWSIISKDEITFRLAEHFENCGKELST